MIHNLINASDFSVGEWEVTWYKDKQMKRILIEISVLKLRV